MKCTILTGFCIMFYKTKEISFKRLYTISSKICCAILFYIMLSICIEIYKMCLDNNQYDGYYMRHYIIFITPHALNLFITVFVIILFMGDIILMDELMRFTIDSVIIFSTLALIY